MKFRAIIKDDHEIKQFINILTSFANMHKNVLVSLRKDKMVIFVCCEDIEAAPICWVDIRSESYFTNYVLKGDSEDCEEILFALHSSRILQTFPGNMHLTNYFTMKLAKHPYESLTIDTEIVGSSSNHKKALQLPILIVPKRNWDNYKLPTELNYDMTVTTSYLRKIRSVIESAKNISPEINICIVAEGVLAFIMQRDEFTTTCQFINQTVIVHKKDEQGNDIAETTCIVNSRKFASILTQHNFQEAHTSFSIKRDRILKIEFEVKRNVVLTCLLPCMFRDDDE